MHFHGGKAKTAAPGFTDLKPWIGAGWSMLQKWIDRGVAYLSVEKHSAALSMITWGVMDGTFKKVLAVSAALALS